MDLAVGLVVTVGAAFVLLAGVGVLRFPDVYARMHAATKASTLGLGLVGAGAGLAIGAGAAKIAVAIACILLTAPSAAHIVGRAAHRAEGIDVDLPGGDELAGLLDADVPPPRRPDGTEPPPRT